MYRRAFPPAIAMATAEPGVRSKRRRSDVRHPARCVEDSWCCVAAASQNHVCIAGSPARQLRWGELALHKAHDPVYCCYQNKQPKESHNALLASHYGIPVEEERNELDVLTDAR
jgi:hypothetical protein